MHILKRHRITVGALSLALLLANSTPVGALLDPRTEPTIEGPLRFGGKTCETTRPRTSSGLQTGLTRNCVYGYAFDPALDGDPQNDYGVVWVQSSVVPKSGWCVKWVKTDINNHDANISRRAPRVNVTRSSAKRFVTKLRTKAAGNAIETGLVKNAFRLFPRSLRSRIMDDGKRLRLIWSGARKRAVSFALGMEVFWDPQISTLDAGAGLAVRLERRC